MCGKVQFQHFQLVPFMRSAKELQGARSSAEAFGGRSAASASGWGNPQCNSNFSPRRRRVTDFNWFPGAGGPTASHNRPLVQLLQSVQVSLFTRIVPQEVHATLAVKLKEDIIGT